MFYNDFLAKIEAKIPFTENEREDLFHEVLFDDECIDFEIVSEYDGDWSRWTHDYTKVFRINGRYFECYASLGNTEMQENEYWYDPIEVTPITKVVTVTEYVPIEAT